MPTLDLSSYHQPSGTGADGTKYDNALDAIQTAVNGIDNNNFASGKIFDPAKIMQSGASTGQALVWNGTDWDNAYVAGRGLFSTRRSTDQSISATSTEKVQFATEDVDVDSWFDAATNYRFTPLVAGYYDLSATISFTNSWNAGVSAGIHLYKNGSAHRVLWRVTDGMNVLDGSWFGGSAIVTANGSTDYFEVFIENGDSAGRNVQGRFEGYHARSS